MILVNKKHFKGNGCSIIMITRLIRRIIDMVNIMLCCAAGMSTSLLVEKNEERSRETRY